MNSLSERETATETLGPALDIGQQLEFEDQTKREAEENTAE